MFRRLVKREILGETVWFAWSVCEIAPPPVPHGKAISKVDAKTRKVPFEGYEVTRGGTKNESRHCRRNVRGMEIKTGLCRAGN